MSLPVYSSIHTGEKIDDSVSKVLLLFDIFEGIENKTTTFNDDGSISETTDLYSKTTTFFDDGNIREQIYEDGVLKATKNITFSDNGVTEVIS